MGEAEDQLNWYLKACEIEKLVVSPGIEARLRARARELDKEKANDRGL